MAKRRWRRLTPEVRREVIRLARNGATYRDIKGGLDLPNGTIGLALKPLGGVLRGEQWEPRSDVRLSLDNRSSVQCGGQQHHSFRVIAAGLGRAPSTICREENRHGGRDHYRAVAAHRQAELDARRPKAAKLGSAELGRVVEAGLLQLWSPEEIAAKLRLEFADRPEMWVSHETIYKSLYVQGRGELRRELHPCLRTGRAQRRHQGRIDTRGQIPNMVMISERPADVDDRAVPGHWEGDLIMGANNRSAIGTLVERSTRFVMLLHLPHGRSAEAVGTPWPPRSSPFPKRCDAPSPGTKAKRCSNTPSSPSTPVCPCSSAIRTRPGSGAPTKTPTACYASTFPKGISLRRFTDADLDAAADGGIRPEELHVRLFALEITQAVGHQLVGHMAFEIDQKAVVTEAALRRTRVQVGQVDGARRELLEDRQQAARGIGLLEHD